LKMVGLEGDVSDNLPWVRPWQLR